MRAEFHPAAIVADAHVRVMVLAMHEPGDRVHECKGLVIVVERPALPDDLPVVRPTRHLREQRIDSRAREGRRPGGQGSAFPSCERRHVSPPRSVEFAAARCAAPPAGENRRKPNGRGPRATSAPWPYTAWPGRAQRRGGPQLMPRRRPLRIKAGANTN